MRTIAGLCLFAFVCSNAAYAQAVAGSGAVSGIIRDPYGDGIPDTTVVIYNQSLGISRTLTTTDDGLFEAPALTPGPGYSLKVTRKGFGNYEARNLQVSIGQNLKFDISLQVETTVTQVDAATALPLLDDTKESVSIAVTAQQLEGLPVSGRLLDSLVLLAPAVTGDPSNGVLAFRGEASTNSFLTDGNNTTNLYYLQKPGIAPQVAQEAVEQMQVVSVAGSAEFGHAMGGMVNAATRSGTNGVHGSLYDYFADRDWNAPDRYAPGFNPALRQNQAGASAGGSILPNKLFGYANFESTSGNSQAFNRITNPLIAGPTGSSVLPSNCKASTAQCAAAINFLNGQMDVPVGRSQHSSTGLLKLDYRPSQTQTFTVEGNAMNRRAPNGSETETVSNDGGLLGYNGTYNEDTRYAKAGWTSVLTGHTVNELRGGWFQDRFSEAASTGLLPSTGLVAIDVAGATIGANPSYPSSLKEQRYQLVDNLNWTNGQHSLKLGFDLSQNRDRMDQLDGRYGTYHYASLTSFAQDFSTNPLNFRNYVNYTQTLGNPVTDLRTREFDLYAQDTWKPLPHLTLTGGVRWEKTHVPQPNMPNPDYYQSGSIGSPSTDFSPRVGAAYMLHNDTVIRVGFGFYYQPFVGELLRSLYADNGVYQSNITVNPTQSGAPVFPKTIATGSIPTGTENVVFAATKFRNPYSEQATVSIEQRLSSDTTLTLSYIQSRGVKLWTATDINLTAATTTKTYTIQDTNGYAVNTYSTLIWNAKNANNYAHVYEVGNGGSSKYSALAVEVKKRMAHGLAVQVSYTRSSATDDMSGTPVVGFIPSTLAPGDFAADKGPSAFDQQHRGVVNFTWQPRVTANNSPAARFLLNGWQLSSITTLASSLPETAVVVVQGQQFSGITMAYTNSLNGSGGWSRLPNQAVNGLHTGAEYNVDARVTRTLPFSERVKGSLLFEAFNVFNTQWNTGVNTIAYTATSGVLRPVTGLGAGNAAYGFPYGTNARRCQVAFRVVF